MALPLRDFRPSCICDGTCLGVELARTMLLASPVDHDGSAFDRCAHCNLAMLDSGDLGTRCETCEAKRCAACSQLGTPFPCPQTEHDDHVRDALNDALGG